MSDPFNYQTQFTLDKAYYAECFDESVYLKFSSKAYSKSIGFILAGGALLMTGINSYASWFIIGLGVLEALSVKFKRPWYLMRQMMSKAAGNQATLTIDEHGIHTQSIYVNHTLTWQQIDSITETERGFLLTAASTKHYLSKRYLDQTCCDYLVHQGEENSADKPEQR